MQSPGELDDGAQPVSERLLALVPVQDHPVAEGELLRVRLDPGTKKKENENTV